jgi:putative peptide zinc metalloprotease protein
MVTVSESSTMAEQTEDAIPEQWNHVSKLSPRLHSHTTAHSQYFRGTRWYIISDSARGRHMRINDAAYDFVGRLDGEQTVEEIYQIINRTRGDDGVSRTDILQILSQLFHAGIIHSGLPADVEQLFKHNRMEKNSNRLRRLINPLALRFPLLDPDRFLNRTISTVRPCYSFAGAVFWLMVVGFAAVLLLINFTELATSLKQNIFAPRNIILTIAIFPLMKLFHEFAHAYTVKTWGGEVHEMGISLLVLMPVPYVDASAAWSFREKYKRALVGASGMIVELFLAAIALIIWTLVQPGLIKDAALSAFLIGSVSTILFNANPLLRFDGYYILQDLIEIPNLYSRAGKFNAYLFKRYVLGQSGVTSPATDPSEQVWLSSYGALAWVYRIFITLVIASFLAGKYFIIGLALAVWSLALMMVMPVYRGLKYLLFDTSLNGMRPQALGRTAAVVGALLFTVSIIPFSLYTNAEGIVWVPDQAQVYAGSDGFIERVNNESGTAVLPGDAVVELQNPDLDTRRVVLEARVVELSERLKSEKFADPIAADQTSEELFTAEADLEALITEQEEQILRSTVAGTFVMSRHQSTVGRYVKKGEPVAYVINPDDLIVRVVIPQASIGLLNRDTEYVEVRLADNPGEKLKASIIRQTPAGSNALPSRALGAVGGGEIAVVDNDENGTTTAEKVFQIDIALPTASKVAGLGTRAFVRINHGREILVQQWLRSIQQLLLNTLPF